MNASLFPLLLMAGAVLVALVADRADRVARAAFDAHVDDALAVANGGGRR